LRINSVRKRRKGVAMERMKVREVVSRDPAVMNGALVFAGTRVPVDILIEHLVGGEGMEDFLEGFPSV
jgi:uncharacterized protein (DUF433 family)